MFRPLRRALPARAALATRTWVRGAARLHPLLLGKARELEREHASLATALADGSAYDPAQATKFARLESVVHHLRAYEGLVETVGELEQMLGDAALKAEAEAELEETETSLDGAVGRLEGLLVPAHPFADMPCLLELRPGVGGSEAALFAKDLLDMYLAYCALQRWPTQVLSITKVPSSGGAEGISEAVLVVEQVGAYARLQYEGGIHRVQRVPETETKGRVHTSTAAVIVLPQIEAAEDEGERAFAPGEVRIDVMRARGAGGQHVNTTDSAVRLTHIPTGIVVSMQDDRSQHKNKAKAFMILRARLAEKERVERAAKERSARTSQVTTTDRSDKIRTYNYQQNRITDHRCGFSLYDLTGCMAGESLDTLVDHVDAWARQEAVRQIVG
ncbi:uncharacterized protein V1510DRAFT_414532 [Dipodascopsis tothii]|uniref:uncharacterized protein n=1 Tax=Dipodascopsis tothii TaxID=44089 RepID=UPI0034CDC3FB